MIPKHEDIKVDGEKPFLNCKLEREPYAEILTGMIKNHSDGFVLAINNEWGTGKTTFVKMWKQYLENEKFKTLYFNAWENDFEKDALVALISELNELDESKSKKIFKNVVEKAAPITKKIAVNAAKSIIEKYVGKEFTKDVLTSITEGSIEGLESELKSYTERKKNIKQFKKSLSEFVTNVSEEKPVVFIIDELDRCRPNYAVEVLEQIKHLFSVSGIIFVLSIDKIQLGNAVRGVYGSEQIDAEEYLRRFIDIEYSLPEPNTDLFCNYLFEYFGFKKFFTNRRNAQENYDTFMNFSINLFKIENLTLRIQEKIFAHARVAISSFGPEFLIPSVFIFLIHIKLRNPDLYKSISSLRLNTQELIDNVENLFVKKVPSDALHSFILMEAQLLTLYYNAYSIKNYNSRLKLFESKGDGTEKFTISSQVATEGWNLEKMTKHIQERSDYFSTRIEHLTRKIDLIERLKY